VANVLLFGATGLVGWSMRRVLKSLGHEVIAPTRASADLLDRDACFRVASRPAPDVVMDCTVPARPGDDAADDIVTAARNVAAVASRAGAHLIYVSCAHVFDGAEQAEFSESSPVRPRSSFGCAKAAAERVVADTCDRHGIVRTANTFGAGRGNFVSRLLDAGRHEATITLPQDVILAPTYADYLATAVEGIISAPRYGLFHVTAHGTCTAAQLARNVYRIAGVACEVRPSTDGEVSVELPTAAPLLTTAREGCELPAWRLGLTTYLAELAATRAREPRA
jgi:dTDP-4-dehydrorhamnose reductase